MKTSTVKISYGRVVPTGPYMNERMEVTVEASLEVDPLEENDLFHSRIDNLTDEVREAINRQLPSKTDVKREGYGPIKKYTGTTVECDPASIAYLKKMQEKKNNPV